MFCVLTLFNLQGTRSLRLSAAAELEYHAQAGLSTPNFYFFRGRLRGVSPSRRALGYYSTKNGACQRFFSIFFGLFFCQFLLPRILWFFWHTLRKIWLCLSLECGVWSVKFPGIRKENRPITAVFLMRIWKKYFFRAKIFFCGRSNWGLKKIFLLVKFLCIIPFLCK